MFSERERDFFLPPRRQRPFSQTQMSPGRRPRQGNIFGPPMPANNPKKSMSNIEGIKNMFQAEDGSWDFPKIMSTAKQINGVYNEVRPFISGFLKKK